SEVNTKALTFMNPESFTEAEGTIEPIANIKGEEAVSILEIAAGAVVAGTSIPQNYVQIGLNSSSYANITDDGLSVVENACLYLLGELQFEAGGEGTDILMPTADNVSLSIYPNPIENQLFVKNNGDEMVVTLQLFTIDGILISSSDIYLSEGVNSVTRSELNVASGSYLVRIMDNNGADLLNKFIIVK
ncbi:MAG: T9SS type A sorting domain-containing protein, partial [Paludibacteraceae bacterium]|nr:T9SS type A sorting domain-containing protein [Paludibacteraceae bacterium]